MHAFRIRDLSAVLVLGGAVLLGGVPSASAQGYHRGVRGPYFRNTWHHHHWGRRGYPRPDYRGPLRDGDGWYDRFGPQRRWWENGDQQ